MGSAESDGRHVGIIPDGGRRWSRRTGTPLVEAYRATFRGLEVFINALHETGCTEVTVYCLSKANLGRPATEVDAVIEALDVFPAMITSLRQRQICGRLAVVGDTTTAPQLATRLRSLPFDDQLSDTLGLNLLFCYDGWDELRAAVTKKGGALALEDLWLPRRVDSIIRTAGGVLLSGFLPMQSQYAQIVSTDSLFNDLTPSDMEGLVRRTTQVHHQRGL